MAWERIRHWQWLVIAVVLGLIVAKVREQYVDDAIKDFGESLNGQANFESAVLRPVQGHRQFEDLTVTPELIDDGQGGKRFVHVVRGMYWDGHLNRADGSARAAWGLAFFVAPFPYRTNLDTVALGPAGAQIAADLAPIKDPTVLDFLRAVHRTHGVNYHYAWYRGSAYAIWLWEIGCVLLIGVALPVTINLMVFGTVWRPRGVKEEAVDLSKVAPLVAKPPVVNEEDFSRLAELEREMEAGLGGGAPGAALGGSGAPAPVAKLTAGKLETATAEGNKHHTDFGADKDDFYPTERHARH